MREHLKTAGRFAALIVALPALASFALRARFMGRDRALEGSTQTLALLPGVFGQYVRRAFLAQVLAECAPTATVCFGTIFSKSGARIEAHAYVGPGGHLGLVHLEKDVLIGAGVHITSGPETHGTADVTRPIREQQGRAVVVRIGSGSWIGSGTIVMADVGSNSIVGAGAVVTKPVPDGVFAAGVPATVIRTRQ